MSDNKDLGSLPPTRGEGQGQDETFRLPQWNDLTNAQRSLICNEAERWSFDQYLERDAAGAIYAVIRHMVRVEPPPLMLRFAAGQSLTEASVYGSSPLINEAQPLPPGGHSHEG